MRIAISGKMCSGKTTLAEQLMANEPRFVKLSFAQPIYDLAREYFGMAEKNRALLIHIGESFRAWDETVWIKAFLRHVEQLEAEGKWVLVDDLRLPQEHKALRENGFRLVRLNVSFMEQQKRLTIKYPESCEDHFAKRTHSTECGLDNERDWDVYATQDAAIDWVYKIVSVFK